MLNVLYTTFDVLTDPRKNPNIYKVLVIFIVHSQVISSLWEGHGKKYIS